jgi:DNA-binding NarL/FixJ family response regulator
MEQEHLKEIATSLKQIAKILAGLLLRDLEEFDQGKKILRLRGCGFSNNEIAEMLHTTPQTVQVTASQLKAKKNRSRTKKRK